jgi:hypothetical protein
MDKLSNIAISIWGRYAGMTRGQQIGALVNLSIDILLCLLLLAMLYVGFTRDFNAFYFWIPFLIFVLWRRYILNKIRWSA